MKTILLIDDCNEYREITASLLLDAGYDVWEVDCAKDAFPLLKREKFDLIVCDLHLPFTKGEEQEDYVYSYEVGVRTIQELKTAIPDVPLIALSNTAPDDLRNIAKYLDPVPAYTKPISNDDVITLIGRCLADKSLTIVQ